MSFIRKSPVRFTGKKLLESTADLCNPSRGWYRIYSFALDEKPDFDEQYWCLRADEALVLVIIDIGAFRMSAIPEKAMETFADILQFFSENEKEIILRIVYDREGHGIEREPNFQQIVEEHMRQLGSVIREFAGSIFLVQGLLIGSWGEMHDSKFLSKERLLKLLYVWREAIGNEIAIAVRTPQQWRFLHKETDDLGKVAIEDKVGLFDDGMFGSSDDLGTYGFLERQKAKWDDSWCREDEISWMREITRIIPYGGEAVGTSEVSLKKAVEEMRCTSLTYLNKKHDKERLDAWKQSTWQETGVWNGVSGFDYIGCHLGYRFVLRKVSLKSHHREEFFSLLIENVGFAALREEAELLLIFETADGENICQIYPCDLCHLEGGRQMTIDLRLPELERGESYEVYQSVNRKRDGKNILFANEPVSKRVCLGSLIKG